MAKLISWWMSYLKKKIYSQLLKHELLKLKGQKSKWQCCSGVGLIQPKVMNISKKKIEVEEQDPWKMVYGGGIIAWWWLENIGECLIKMNKSDSTSSQNILPYFLVHSTRHFEWKLKTEGRRRIIQKYNFSEIPIFIWNSKIATMLGSPNE